MNMSIKEYLLFIWWHCPISLNICTNRRHPYSSV